MTQFKLFQKIGHAIIGTVDTWESYVVLKQQDAIFVIDNVQSITAYKISKSEVQLKSEISTIQKETSKQVELPFNEEKPQKLVDLHRAKSSLEKELLKKKYSSHEINMTEAPLNSYKPFGIK